MWHISQQENAVARTLRYMVTSLPNISPPTKSPPIIELSFIVFISLKHKQQNNEKNFHEQKFSLNRYFFIIIIKLFQRSDWWLWNFSISQMSKFTFTEPITQYLEY